MHRPLLVRRSANAVLLAALVLLVGVTTQACAQPGSADGAMSSGRSGANPPVPLDSLRALADASRMKGSPDAPITIIEVSDFQCPYCAQWALETYPQVDSAFIQTGRARLLFINYPLPNHAQAWAASEAAMCAGVQGRFWEMHDRIFAAQRDWSGQPDAADRFGAFAREMGLDLGQYRDCTVYDRTASLIVSDAMQASQASIRGTPTFIIGQRMVGGAVPFEEFSQEIEAAIQEAQAAAGQPQ
jgi:protein-disulfide isomerase